MSEPMTNMNISKNDNAALRELTSGRHWFIKNRHTIAVQKLVNAFLNRDEKVLDNIDELARLRKDNKDKAAALEQQKKESSNQIASLCLQLEDYKKSLQNRDEQIKEGREQLEGLGNWISKMEKLGVKQREDNEELRRQNQVLQQYKSQVRQLEETLKWNYEQYTFKIAEQDKKIGEQREQVLKANIEFDRIKFGAAEQERQYRRNLQELNEELQKYKNVYEKLNTFLLDLSSLDPNNLPENNSETTH
jgi:chromosome segregation ATPase